MKIEAHLLPRRAELGKGWGKALLITMPMALMTAFMFVGGIKPVDPLQLAGTAVAWAFYNTVFFLMVKTGGTDRYRTVLFVTIALCFILDFTAGLIETRGSRVLSAADAAEGRTPFCHIVIPFTIIPAVLTRTIIFPGSMLEGFANIGTMLVIWLGGSLVMGRGWCGWACFYGGLDEGFSRLAKKRRIGRIDGRWLYLPFAVLAAMVLLSLATLAPAYCVWLCPFKAVTESPAVDSLVGWLQTGLFVALFLALVVVLPFLTKRRIQCGLFCPFGAMQSFTNKMNVFEIRIDREKCRDCGLCIEGCPTFSLDERTIKEGRTRLTCVKCGRCVDICPRGAARYHLKGTPVKAAAGRARMLFLYPVFLFTAVFTGGMVAGAVWRLLRLLATGRLI